MFHDEHNPPHFHARYGGAWASFSIGPTRRTRGGLPSRIERLVLEWAALHEDELTANWSRAQRDLELNPIDPLD